MVTTPVILPLPPVPTPPPAIMIEVIAPPLPPASSPTEIKGQVTDVRPGGTVTIKTENGPVTVRFTAPQNTTALTPGQTVTITLSPNRSGTQTAATLTVSAGPTVPPVPTQTPQILVPIAPSQDSQNLTNQLRALATRTVARLLGTTTPTLPLPEPMALRPLSIPAALGTLRSLTLPPILQTITPPALSAATTLPSATSAPATAIMSNGMPESGFFLLSPTSPSISAPLNSWLEHGFSALPTRPNVLPQVSPTSEGSPITINNADIHAVQTGTTGQTRPMMNVTFYPLATGIVTAPSAPFSQGRAFETMFTVMGTTPDGPILHHPETGGWSIATKPNGTATWAVGTQIRGIAVMGPPLPTIALPPSMNTLWAGLAPLLDDLLNTLPANGAIPRPVLPNAAVPAQLAAAATLFIAAARTGDFSALMSERTIDSLRRAGKGATLDRLQDLFKSNVQTRAADTTPAAGEWRSFLLPLGFQGPIVPVMLHTRALQDDQNQNANQDSPSNNSGGQRFVLDLNFDRMGAVQLDMLYRPGVLDSVLRTELPLSAAMRMVLVQKYAGAMTRVSHTGELLFQDGVKNWVMIHQNQDQVSLQA